MFKFGEDEEPEENKWSEKDKWDERDGCNEVNFNFGPHLKYLVIYCWVTNATSQT